MSAENHEWFNKQSKAAQAEMNKIFQEYKKQYKECGVVFTDDLKLDIEVKAFTFDIPLERPKEKYNRAKENREFRRRVDEEWER